jgi:hypothetical protein
MSPALLFLLAAPLVAPAAPGATAPAGSRIGVFSISIVGADPSLQTTAIDALASAVAATGTFQVVSRTDLEAMLGAEKLRDRLGCDEVSCFAEIGLAAGVERVLAGSVSRVEHALVVSLQLVNVAYGSVENRVTLSWDGPTAGLADVLTAGAQQLVVPLRDRKPGRLRLVGLDAEATVLVDGEPRPSPTGPVAGLAVGVHRVRIDAAGHEPFEAPFVVTGGADTTVSVVLKARAEPAFYTRWWFWTAAAAVVAGGTAAILVTRGGASTAGSGTFTLPYPPPTGAR